MRMNPDGKKDGETMNRIRNSALVCFAALVFSTSQHQTVEAQEIRAEVIRKAKSATALVVLPSARGFGSAVCLDEAGYFLTNEHVVRSSGSSSVTLVLAAGEDDQQVVEAEVVRRDKEKDLALLKANGKRNYTPLELGLDTELVETQTLIAFGYPFGTALKVKEKEYPSISVNVGRITALRRNKGKLEQIQTDAQVNPGNSGGPVITTDGKVVAIVRSGLLRTGVNFTIPVFYF